MKQTGNYNCRRQGILLDVDHPVDDICKEYITPSSVPADEKSDEFPLNSCGPNVYTLEWY